MTILVKRDGMWSRPEIVLANMKSLPIGIDKKTLMAMPYGYKLDHHLYGTPKRGLWILVNGGVWA